MRRALAILATLAMVASLTMALPAAGQEPDVGDGAAVAGSTGGTGVLPNFAAEGDTLIRLQAGAFDPLADPLPDPAGIDLVGIGGLAAGEPAYWLVQVADGRFASARDAIEGAGGVVSGALADATYTVRATLAQRTAFDASSAVRWSGLYQPAWKAPVAAADRDGLLDWLESRERGRLLVYLFRAEPDPAATVAAIDAIAGADVASATDRVVEVHASADAVPAIAALTGVEWVTAAGQEVLHNTDARWVNDTGVRDLQWAIRDDRLTGAGQTAAVADTAVNYLPDLNGRAHIAFSDCDPDCLLADYTQAEPGSDAEQLHDTVSNETDHRKMAAYFDIGDAGVSARDPSGHGTHVAGTVLGDHAPWGTWSDEHEDGIAPGARLVMQNISTTAGALTTPSDIYELFAQSYRPRDPESVVDGEDLPYVPDEDARTHNNSWGVGVPLVDTGRPGRVDEFVWENEDKVIVFSAGNAGPNAGSISEPSTAKNILTSAASMNGRMPMASIDSLAGFSSHGPTADGRFGPDLATPGEVVVSPKGGTEDESHYLQGTSMSAPVLTGLATLVREYFWEGYGPVGGQGSPTGERGGTDAHSASAALVKATLVNGATRMRGPHTGDDGDTSSMDGQYPSAGQGFGLANLANSLYFDGDPTGNWFVDVRRDDDEAFGPADSFSDVEWQVEVAAGEPLEVTLAWTDAPNALAGGTPSLVNDLDLVVVSPSGDTYVGNNFNTRTNPGADEHETIQSNLPRDTTNNTEKVRVADPEAGTWTIRVDARLIMEGPQGFALAASGLIADSGSFDAGPPRQVPTAGAPVIDDLHVEPVSADTARLTFTTDEPTTAWAEIEIDGATVRFDDVYNWGDDSPYVDLFDTASPRTSDGYADRPVVSDRHEILLAGMRGGETYHVEITVEDLTGATTSADAVFTAAPNVFQPQAADMAQLFGDDTDALPFAEASGWQTGAQLYTGNLGATEALGAFMFRLPEELDPDTVTGAAVVVRGAHVFASRYDHEPIVSVDLLGEDEEDDWGSQNYSDMRDAEPVARALPETTVLRGGQTAHAFPFRCTDLDALLGSLERVDDGERLAAFRMDATHVGGLPSYEFGFNHRSFGPHLRPQLVLYTDDGADDQTGPCDPDTPAPTITDVGVNDAHEDDAVVVSWQTDVPADSLVLLREQGSGADWTQVGSRALTTSHQVQIRGLDPDADYEFGVRSVACNGATSTADNDGEGWDLRWPEVPQVTFFLQDIGGEPSFAEEEPDGSTSSTQQASWFPEEERDQPYHPDAAHWTGAFSGTIERPLQIEWWWSSPSPLELAFASDVEVTVFADPVDDGSDQPDNVIGRGGSAVAVSVTPDSARSTVLVDVSGEVSSELQIQVRPVWDDMIVIAHYDAEQTPSNLVIEPEGDVSLPADLARVGPVRPPSAEGSIDLSQVATRTVASAEDRAAGTARGCGEPQVTRAAGEDRVGTSVAVSQRSHDGGSDTVVIARADDYPDALAGSPLARRLDAPILLTAPGSLDDRVADEIDRLGATHAVILGGTAAISNATQQAIISGTTVTSVERYDGRDRFETAAVIAAALGGDRAYLVEGGHADPARGWPDAVAVAGLAAHTQRPVLLTLAGSLPSGTADALDGIRHATIVGGEVAVSSSVEQAVTAGGTTVDRLAGADRFATSHEVARASLAAGMAPGRTWVATGNNWPDALVAGPATAEDRTAFHLAHGTDLDRSPDARAWVTAHRTRLGQLTLTGGTAAIAAAFEGEVRTVIRIE